MNEEKIVKIYISLLEEGTPTIRPAEALVLGDNFYKILPIESYDPKDEIWEFLPETIVFGQERLTDKNERILLATAIPVPRSDLIKKYPTNPILPVLVSAEGERKVLTDAIFVKSGLYLLLPTEKYNVVKDKWEFSPGSIVRTIKEKDEIYGEILYAFDQIREDRLASEYANYVLKGA